MVVIGELKVNNTFIYKNVVWKKTAVFWNSTVIKEYLGEQVKLPAVAVLVKCFPLLGKQFQPMMFKFFNVKTIVEKIITIEKVKQNDTKTSN